MDKVRLPDGAVPAIYFVDLDGTLLSVSSEKFFLKHLLKKGILSPGAFLRFLSSYAFHPLRTIREGKGWNRTYLRGISPGMISGEAEACAKILVRDRIREWTLQSIIELKEAGSRIILLSASLEYIVAAIAKEIQADEICASVPEITGSFFTGDLTGLRPWGENKVDLAKSICKWNNIDPVRCVAAGDSWADRFLLRTCGGSVAVCPDRKLGKLALIENWGIVEGKHTKWA